MTIVGAACSQRGKGRAILVSRAGISFVAGLVISLASLAVMLWGSEWPTTTGMLVDVVVTLAAVGLAVAHAAFALG